MINVDEVTASRLIFAPMGILLGKCCGNAASKIACGRSPNRGNSRHSAKLGEDPVFIARDIKLAPPISGNGTDAKASDVRFVAALKVLAYAALTFAESTPLTPWRSTT